MGKIIDDDVRDFMKFHEERIDNIVKEGTFSRQDCLHDNCSSCHGTGRKADGSMCIHMISCPCPKCSPTC